MVTTRPATIFVFTKDEDHDGRIDHCRSAGPSDCSAIDDNIENELIAYRLNNDRLEMYRGDVAEWQALTADNVSDLEFIYLDENDSPASESAAIRTVEISITVQEPAGRAGTLSRTYSTRIRCRNLGL